MLRYEFLLVQTASHCVCRGIEMHMHSHTIFACSHSVLHWANRPQPILPAAGEQACRKIVWHNANSRSTPYLLYTQSLSYAYIRAHTYTLTGTHALPSTIKFGATIDDVYAYWLHSSSVWEIQPSTPPTDSNIRPLRRRPVSRRIYYSHSISKYERVAIYYLCKIGRFVCTFWLDGDIGSRISCALFINFSVREFRTVPLYPSSQYGRIQEHKKKCNATWVSFWTRHKLNQASRVW